MKTSYGFLAIYLLFGLTSCSSIAVKTDYDHDVNFSRYKIFKWMPFPKNPGERSIQPNSMVDKRIRRAVENELLARGYEVIESGKADALLAYHIGVQQKVDVTHWGYRYRRPRRHVHRYKEGSLILDVVDPRMKHLVWRGWATGVVGDIDASEEKIGEAVAKVLEKYPPQG